MAQQINKMTTKEAFQKVIEASKSEMLRIGEKALSADRDTRIEMGQAQADLNQAIWQMQNLSDSLFGWEGAE